MIDVGSYLGFYGCLWFGHRSYIELLTPLYDLSTTAEDETQGPLTKFDEAREDDVVQGISRARHDYGFLTSANQDVQEEPEIAPPGPTYPYITSFQDQIGRERKFTYLKRIKDKLTFYAKLDEYDPACECETVFVKFTKRYSQDVHRSLSERAYAPKLRAAISLQGGWIMVVMDESVYTPLHKITLSDNKKQLVWVKVLEIVGRMHENGFVHGDLRNANILVDQVALARDNTVLVHIIDFDWAGRVEGVVYPQRINTETVKRPQGVTDEAPILFEHDLEMVEYIFTSG